MAIKNKNITTLEGHLTKQYGKRGTIKRAKFEIKATAFMMDSVIDESKAKSQAKSKKGDSKKRLSVQK